MTKKPDTCNGCALHHLGKGFAKPEGHARKKLLVVAEALGENEAKDSLPLRPYAQSGAIFERALMALRMSRDDVVIHNIVNCQPPGNVLEGAWYKYEAISHCKRNLDRVVEEYQPTAILALGGVSLESLTGMKGRKRNISSLRGYVLWCENYGLPMVATYHPSFIARGKKNLLGVFYADLLKATRLAEGKLVEGKDYYLNPQRDYQTDYILCANVQDIAKEYDYLSANPNIPIAFDIETADSVNEESEDDIENNSTVVTQFQLSHGEGHALVIDAKDSGLTQSEFFWVIQRFMTLPNIKLGHNAWRFDCPVLASYGVKFTEPVYDTMTLAHHIEPDLPAGLQFVASLYNWRFPWKHLAGENLAWYGAVDADVLHFLWPKLKERAIREGAYGEH